MTMHIRVAVKGKYDTIDEMVNVFSFYSSTALNPPAMSDVDTWLDAFYHAGLLAIVSNGVIWDRFVVEGLVAGHWSYVGELPFIKGGTAAGQGLPHMDSYLIVGITNGNRRGKKFIPGVTEDTQSNGLVSAGAIAALATSATAYIATLTSGGDDFISGTISKDGSSFAPFTASRVDGHVHGLNKRFPGRGS